MVWRAVVITFFFFVAVVWAGANIFQENIPDGRVQTGPTGFDEPLRHLKYIATNRHENFLEMGLPEDLADLATAEARKFDPNKKRFRKLLETQALDIGDAFCPKPSDLPQPYAAMQFLVIQDAGERAVVNARNDLFEFERQNWFSVDSNPGAIYETLERTRRRKSGATLMGIAAILSKREADAQRSRGPWGNGFLAGGFPGLESELPSIRQKTADYFALMHFLTELANQPDGICAQ